MNATMTYGQRDSEAGMRFRSVWEFLTSFRTLPLLGTLLHLASSAPSAQPSLGLSRELWYAVCLHVHSSSPPGLAGELTFSFSLPLPPFLCASPTLLPAAPVLKLACWESAHHQ